MAKVAREAAISKNKNQKRLIASRQSGVQPLHHEDVLKKNIMATVMTQQFCARAVTPRRVGRAGSRRALRVKVRPLCSRLSLYPLHQKKKKKPKNRKTKKPKNQKTKKAPTSSTSGTLDDA